MQTMEKDHGQYNDQKKIFWATGACMFVRASAFHEVNGFDDLFFAHMEEIDLCWRMQLAGHSIYYCPDSVVYHIGGGTLPKSNSRTISKVQRSPMMSRALAMGQKAVG